MIPVMIITDGLQGYVSAITAVFPAAKHLLCLFHHQQSVTRCVKTQFGEPEQAEANAAKHQMKRVVQEPKDADAGLRPSDQSAAGP